MSLHPIDLIIILAYLVATLAIGFWISSRASKNINAYFLGGNKLPWYALGMSNASGMFDIAGTMWMVYLLFIYGLNSIFIPWLWPVFNQIFLMMFLAMWLRRSGVMTGAEWISFRFGNNRGAELSHLVIVLFALITVLGYMAYGFLGIGKLAAEFLPIALSSDPAWNEKLYALIIVAITTLYVVKGGMYSVVLTEVVQFFIMFIACIGVALVAMSQVTAADVTAATPEGWSSISFDWMLQLDWSNLVPQADAQIAGDGYSLFTIFVMLALFKGVFQSMAGPAPNYDMQRILSARSPKEASLMSAVVTAVLLVPRYLLIAGLTVLALVYFSDDLNAMGEGADFEAILPFALSNFIPVGLLGLILAGLLAAFMSSFAAALNAAPAYVVNDVYKKYVRPDADDKHYVNLSYLVSVCFVLVGTLIGLFLQSIDDIVFWMTSGLYGGYTAANVLKWYWWRLNGYGYFFGMIAGIGFALILGLPGDTNPFLAAVEWLYNDVFSFGLERIDALNAFPGFFLVCVIAAVAGALMTDPDDEETLKAFYLKTRPWGAWGPVHKMLERDGVIVKKNTDLKLDMFNVCVGLVWQTALMAAPIFLVIGSYVPLAASIVIIAVCTAILKFTWYDHLDRRNTLDGVDEPASV